MKHEWNDQQIKRYIYNKIGMRPGTKSFLSCPRCENVKILVVISAFDGQLRANCSNFRCVNLKN